MYDSNRAAAIEFVRGAGFVILITGIFFGFVLTLGKSDSVPVERFKVIDTYSNCAIVQYNPPSRAESFYFLDCGNQHLEQVR